MTPESQAQPDKNAVHHNESKSSDKEHNFRLMEARYEKQLAQERAARLEAEKAVLVANQAKHQKNIVIGDDDDDDEDPYIDKKKLARKMSDFERRMEDTIDKRAEEKAKSLIAQSAQADWLKTHSDFDSIMQHSQELAENHPDLAEKILRMPSGFERQQLVYSTIKSMGVHLPKEVQKSGVQDKIDANRRSPYYQPSQMGSAPYAMQSDYSETGKKSAYDKMQELKSRLRL